MYLQTKQTVSTHIGMLTLLNFQHKALMMVYEITPSMIPSEMLYAIGIVIKVTNAGMLSE